MSPTLSGSFVLQSFKQNTWQNNVSFLPVTATSASCLVSQANYMSGTWFSSQLARESFPPCMRHLHESLRRDHRLWHFGRLQYGLFLKSIGLTLEQALMFWRTEFTKKMEPDMVCDGASSICSCIHACFFFALFVSELFRVYYYWPMCSMYVMYLTLLFQTLVQLCCPNNLERQQV